MRLIQGITDQPKQLSTIVLPDGTRASIYLEYKQNQKGWFFDFEYGTLIANGQRLCSSPNILRQYISRIPFGISVQGTGRAEPLNVDDFSSGRLKLYLLNEADVALCESLWENS